jgi:hypothetical protein
VSPLRNNNNTNEGQRAGNDNSVILTDEDQLAIEMEKAMARNISGDTSSSNTMLSKEDIKIVLQPEHAGDEKLDALLDTVLTKPRQSTASNRQPSKFSRSSLDKSATNRSNGQSSYSEFTDKLRKNRHLVKRLNTRLDQHSTGNNPRSNFVRS